MRDGPIRLWFLNKFTQQLRIVSDISGIALRWGVFSPTAHGGISPTNYITSEM